LRSLKNIGQIVNWLFAQRLHEYIEDKRTPTLAIAPSPEPLMSLAILKTLFAQKT